MFNRKGMEAGFLVAMIITLAGFTLLAASISKFMSGVDETQAEEICKDSVALRAAAGINLVGGKIEARFSPAICKTIHKKISGSEEEVSEVIAKKMAKCWEMFGAGKYSTSIFETTNLFGNKNNCFICYVLPVEELEDEEREQQKGWRSIPEIDFQQYLATHYPPRLAEAKISFVDYIQNQAGGAGYIMTALTDKGIQENRAYGIVYKGKKKNCGIECKVLIGTGVAAAGAGYLVLNVVTAGTINLVAWGAIAAGGLATGVGAGLEIDDFLQADQSEMDGILLVDMEPSGFGTAVYDECNYVPDVIAE